MNDDDAGFADIDARYRQWAPGLIRYVRRQLHDSGHLAEDIAQDAFLILYRKWPEVQNHPCPKAWLYKVARHLVIKALEKRSHESASGEVPDQKGDPTVSYDTNMAVREAVNKLPERQREAVWLFYFHDFKQDEIATIMQIQRGAVGALLFQARKRLRGLLGW